MRVLILSCNTGEGHNSCAKAIQEAFQAEGIDCGIEDALSFISPGVSHFMSSWHTRIYRHLPGLFRMGYRLAERHQEVFREDSLLSRQLFARGTQRLWEFLRQGGYDAVVCTHVFAALMLTDVRRQHTDWSAWCAFVNTDYTCSPSTGDSKLDRYFIPKESLNGEFTALGIPAERLTASGIPVRRAFRERVPKPQAKAALGIPEECPHLLIMCGSMGCGPIRKLTGRVLSGMGPGERLSVVCGTNQRLYRQLCRRYRSDSRARVLGYADDVPLLMDSADLFLTKPGGLSVTEAEAKGLPMVLINAVAGCEDYNKQYLIQKGCAVEETTVDALAGSCLALLRDGGALKKCRPPAVQTGEQNKSFRLYERMCGNMKMSDYKGFRLNKLNTPQFSHVKLLLFWPVFFLLFQFAEQLYHPDSYYIMHCSLDDIIPFCEWFLIAYLFWFVYLAGAVALTFFTRPDVFRRLMRFIILTYSISLLVYLVFPTCQHLRPLAFQRDNLLTSITAFVYQFDTNTNVCPSMHVIGSIAAMLAFWECEPFNKPGWRAANVAAAVLVCLSTVFMKQHYALDVLAALPLCLLGQFLFFRRQGRFYAAETLFPRRGDRRKAPHVKN